MKKPLIVLAIFVGLVGVGVFGYYIANPDRLMIALDELRGDHDKTTR